MGTTRLVGRAAELAEVEAERQRAASGCFGSLLVVADPGMGKSRLAAELTGRHPRGILVLGARARPVVDGSALGVWAEALERHLHRLPAQDVLDLCGGFAEPLAGLLASVAVAHEAASSRPLSRLVLLEGMATLLARLARRLPLVLVLDDMHLADASSWEALDFFARNVPDAPILVVGTGRPLELAEHPVAADVAGRLEQEGLLRRLELTPLSPGAMAELAEQALGQVAEPALVQWLVERSRGNALFATGLLDALREGGADLSDPRLVQLPGWLAERATACTRTLDAGAAEVLSVLAVLASPVEFDDLARFCDKDLDELTRVLDGLVRARLVAEHERGPELRYEIAYPVVQEALYQRLSGALRRTLHRRLGRALLADGRLAEAAAHLARSARLGEAEAVDVLCQGVREAEEREALAEGLAILDALVRVLPQGDERWLAVADAMSPRTEWVVDHLAHLEAGPHVRQAVVALRQMDVQLTGSPDLVCRATVKFRLGSLLGRGTGELDEAERRYWEAAELFASAGDVGRSWLGRSEVARVRGARGELSAWESGAAEVVTAAEAAGDDEVLGRGLASLGLAQLLRGRLDLAGASLARSLRLAGAAGGRGRVTWTRTMLAWHLALDGRLGEGLAELETAKAADPAWRQTIVPEGDMILRYLAGDLPAALAAAQETAVIDPEATSRRGAVGGIFAALAASEAGLPDLARRHLDLAAAALDGRAWPFSTAYRGYGEAMLAWREGGGMEALGALEQAAERILDTGVPPFAAFLLTDLAELSADVGSAKAAGAAAARLRSVASHLGRDLYHALAALAEGWAALSEGDRQAAGVAAAGVGDVLGALGFSLYAARAREVEGRAAREPSEARAHLEAAVLGFDHAGAAWRRDRVRALLGRGRPWPAGAGSGLAALTARERQVARLAAAGLTARQIAERLVIGRRTVETHRANAYVKLGLRSKTELSRRAGDLGL